MISFVDHFLTRYIERGEPEKKNPRLASGGFRVAWRLDSRLRGNDSSYISMSPMPPMPPGMPAGAFSSFGSSATIASVVRMSAATEAAFCSA